MMALLALLCVANAHPKHLPRPIQIIQPAPITVNNQTNNQVVNYNITPAAQDADGETHLAAHIGTSFAIQTVAYGLNRTLGMSRMNAELVGLVETLAIGYMYKLGEHSPASDVNRAMGENALGAGLAIVTHFTFSF